MQTGGDEHARLASRIATLSAQGESLCVIIGSELARAGLDLPAPRFGDAVFTLSTDPYSGEESLVGDWRNERRERIGGFVIHADGSCHAEWDVVRAHPQDPAWFVEAVCAFGKGANLNSELRLLPMP